jgi:hypothetical protein
MAESRVKTPFTWTDEKAEANQYFPRGRSPNYARRLEWPAQPSASESRIHCQPSAASHTGRWVADSRPRKWFRRLRPSQTPEGDARAGIRVPAKKWRRVFRIVRPAACSTSAGQPVAGPRSSLQRTAVFPPIDQIAKAFRSLGHGRARSLHLSGRVP